MKFNAEEIAKICHNVNKSVCECYGDHSQLEWENAPQWQKDSAINGVNFHLNNKNTKPLDSHISWMKEKIETGWTYGEVKDVNKKTHPCIVEYDLLPLEQKVKDYVFKAIVDNLKNIRNDGKEYIF